MVRVEKNETVRRLRGASPKSLPAYSPQALGAFRFDTPNRRFGMVTGGDLNRDLFHLLPIGAILLPQSGIAVSWAGARSTPPTPMTVSLVRRAGGAADVVWTGTVAAATAPPYRFTAPELLPGGVYECVCETESGLKGAATVSVLTEQKAKDVSANAAFLRRYIASATDNEERGGTYCLLALLYEKHELYADADAAYEKARELLPADQLLKKTPRPM